MKREVGLESFRGSAFFAAMEFVRFPINKFPDGDVERSSVG